MIFWLNSPFTAVCSTSDLLTRLFYLFNIDYFNYIIYN